MGTRNQTDQIRSLSCIFTPNIFRGLINTGSLNQVKSRYNKNKEYFLFKDNHTNFTDLVKLVYKKMYKQYRTEYIYKNEILIKQLLGKYSLNTTTLLNEFRIEGSVADLILVNDQVNLFEIKTDLDNLIRLNYQLNNYTKAVELISIVTNTKYIKELLIKYSNTSFGIIELTDQNTLREHKKATVDKNSFKHSTIFKLLRKHEYLSIVKKIFGAVPNVPNTRIFKACLDLVQKVDVKTFQEMAFQKVKTRTIENPDCIKDDETPDELKFLCYSQNLSKQQFNNLHKLLNQKI